MIQHFHDLPQQVAVCVIGAATSAITILGTWLAPVFGFIDPAVADKWGMQGIYITAIVSLTGFILFMLRWVATIGIATIKENTSALHEVAASNRELNATNARQNSYFEEISKKSLDERLASQSYQEPPTRRRNSPR